MNFKKDEIIYSVTIGEIQFEAKRYIGRELTEDEIYYATKGIDWGLSTDIEIVFQTAIEDSVVLSKKYNKEQP